MSLAFQLPTRTTSKKQSIWRNPSESVMRQHMVALEQASGEVPDDPKVHSLPLWQERHPPHHDGLNHALPMGIEQRMSDDIAFVAASEDDVRAVSAVSVEERTDLSGLVVRLAVNDRAPPQTVEILKAIFEELGRCASKKLSRTQCSQNIFSKVMTLCEGRIHGRLQSIHWRKPKHLHGKVKEPLYQSLRKLMLRLQALPKTAESSDDALFQGLSDLCAMYKAIDECLNDSDRLHGLLKVAIQQSHAISTRSGTCTLERTISSYGFVPSEMCQDKNIRQMYKIGRYWGLCVELPEYARKHPALFQRVDIELMPSYRPTLSSIFFKTSRSPSVECYVHAEIQLLLHYDFHSDPGVLPPRVLGVSKAACYLCNLFILEHGRFFHTKTHGRLYDQWTMPDLAVFSEPQRNNYRRILKAIDKTILSATRRQPQTRRPHPGQSWLSLLTPQAGSPTVSEARTIISKTSGSTTPRASNLSISAQQPVRSVTAVSSQHFGSPELCPARPSQGNLPFHDTGQTPSVHPPPSPPPTPGPATPRSVSQPTAHSSCGSMLHSDSWASEKVTHQVPIHLTGEGISITIEIEEPASGRACIIESGQSQVKGTFDVDVDAFLPGETLSLVNEEGASKMLLALRRHNKQVVFLELAWT